MKKADALLFSPHRKCLCGRSPTIQVLWVVEKYEGHDPPALRNDGRHGRRYDDEAARGAQAVDRVR